MIRRPLLILLLLLGIQVHTQASETVVSATTNRSGHSSVLTGKQAIALSKQCSRPAPEGVIGSWKPSPKQIRRLEEHLHQYLREHYPAIYQRIHQHYFQFAGLSRKQGRFIYINALDEYAHNNPDWRHSAFIVCDGGDQFWGLEYEPITEKFSAMHFNLGLPQQ